MAGAIGHKAGYATNLNMSALDRLVSQDDDDEYDDSDADSDDNSDEEQTAVAEVDEDLENIRGPESPFYAFDGRLKEESSDEEWAAIIQEYRREPTTELER